MSKPTFYVEPLMVLDKPSRNIVPEPHGWYQLLMRVHKALLGAMLLVGCVTYGEPQTIEGHVWRKDYHPAYNTTAIVGKMITTQYHPAQYLVTLHYGGEESVENNRELYQSAYIGERVRVLVHYPITSATDSTIAGEPEVVTVQLLPRGTP